jgi:hypothetical protein
MGDKEWLMTRHNARLYTFAGYLATRNHVFLHTYEEQDSGEAQMGTYIFAHSESYPVLCQFIVQHAFPMRLNENEVQQCDEDSFQRSLEQLSGSLDEDFMPDWFEDGEA